MRNALAFRSTLLNSDCVRCHGMLFEGDVDEIVTPIDLQGPWEVTAEELANRTAIPCLACHRIHSEGEPMKRPDYAHPESVGEKRVLQTDSLAFYDRHEGISCLSFYTPHSLDARASCRTCHPKMSNCGLEVERMDSPFRSSESPHNIHLVD